MGAVGRDHLTGRRPDRDKVRAELSVTREFSAFSREMMERAGHRLTSS